MKIEASTYANAPMGALLLGLGNDGRGNFTSRTAGVIVVDRPTAEDFVRGLPKTAQRRVFIRERLGEDAGGFSVVTDAYTHHQTALTQFNRFITHATRLGFTPMAALVPVERRGIGHYAELADIEAVYGDLLSTKD